MGNLCLRLLLDSNVIDAAADDDAFLQLLVRAVEAEAAEVLVTHVQIDEILVTPEDNPRRQRLVDVLAKLPAERIATYGIVFGLSRWDNARLTDDEGAALIKSLRGENLRHTEDALLIATAQYERAVFVSSDRRAVNAALRHSVSAMSTEQLRVTFSAGPERERQQLRTWTARASASYDSGGVQRHSTTGAGAVGTGEACSDTGDGLSLGSTSS